MEDFVFFPDSWLCCETHICLQPVFAFNGTPKRSIEFIEIGYTTVSSTEALASVFHFGQSNRFHSGFVDSFLQTSQKRATTFFREGLWIRHVSRT